MNLVFFDSQVFGVDWTVEAFKMNWYDGCVVNVREQFEYYSGHWCVVVRTFDNMCSRVRVIKYRTITNEEQENPLNSIVYSVRMNVFEQSSDFILKWHILVQFPSYENWIQFYSLNEHPICFWIPLEIIQKMQRVRVRLLYYETIIHDKLIFSRSQHSKKTIQNIVICCHSNFISICTLC